MYQWLVAVVIAIDMPEGVNTIEAVDVNIPPPSTIVTKMENMSMTQAMKQMSSALVRLCLRINDTATLFHVLEALSALSPLTPRHASSLAPETVRLSEILRCSADSSTERQDPRLFGVISLLSHPNLPYIAAHTLAFTP